jgi:hypothetical protein
LEGDNKYSSKYYSFTLLHNHWRYIREEVSKIFGESTKVRQFGSGICEDCYKTATHVAGRKRVQGRRRF